MERVHKNRILSESASLGLKSCSFPSVSWSISLFSFSQEIKCSTNSCLKKDPKQTQQNVKPHTQVGPYVVTYSLFAICLFNMAKLADYYSVYEIQAQQNSAGPAIAGWASCRRDPRSGWTPCQGDPPSGAQDSRASLVLSSLPSSGSRTPAVVLCFPREPAESSLCSILLC